MGETTELKKLTPKVQNAPPCTGGGGGGGESIIPSYIPNTFLVSILGGGILHLRC